MKEFFLKNCPVFRIFVKFSLGRQEPVQGSQEPHSLKIMLIRNQTREVKNMTGVARSPKNHTHPTFILKLVPTHLKVFLKASACRFLTTDYPQFFVRLSLVVKVGTMTWVIMTQKKGIKKELSSALGLRSDF